MLSKLKISKIKDSLDLSDLSTKKNTHKIPLFCCCILSPCDYLYTELIINNIIRIIKNDILERIKRYYENSRNN